MPGALRGLPAEVLEWPAWSIQARLEPEAVSSSLAAMLGPHVDVISAERRPLRARATVRSHQRALFRVAYRGRGSAGPEEMDVLVKGVGLGYLGAHAEAVSRALAGRIPTVLGVREGLLYRRWLPDAGRVSRLGPEHAADVVDYSLTRAEGLPVDEDMSLRLLDRGAVWQRAGDILARVFGRGAQFSRPLVYPLARTLLRTAAPSVIDGRMEPDRWFESETGTLLKVDTDESGFSSLDIHCYDALFDLASWDDQGLGRAVRDDYARRTGRTIEPERWLLYRLVHLAELGRDQSRADPATERAFARELQRYYGDTLLAGLDPAVQGALCAIDVDWTLEGRGLGFPGTTPAGALALRALAGHGFRTVLATGRSLDELRERCDAYRLAGGVAEYGAWTYDHGTRHARRLLSAHHDMALDRLRAVLKTISGVEVDPTYQGAIRAYSFTTNGARIGLTPDTVREALESAAVTGQVRAISGALQTDFMANGVDKATGIQALALQLGVDLDAADGKPLQLAVGDSAEDLPMMRLARVAAAPARAALRDQPAGVRFMREPGPKAVAEAAEILIGHRPGGCARCRVAPVSHDSRLLLDFLATQDVRPVARPAHALRLISAVRRRAATID